MVKMAERMKRRPVFQKVTQDRFRLVLAQADTITELAEMVGVSVSALSHAFKKLERGKRREENSCYQITWIEVEE